MNKRVRYITLHSRHPAYVPPKMYNIVQWMGSYPQVDAGTVNRNVH